MPVIEVTARLHSLQVGQTFFFFNKQVEMNMQNNYIKYNVSLTTARQLGRYLL